LVNDFWPSGQNRISSFLEYIFFLQPFQLKGFPKTSAGIAEGFHARSQVFFTPLPYAFKIAPRPGQMQKRKLSSPNSVIAIPRTSRAIAGGQPFSRS
jgi:hypothetical protein